jgi:Asp-tRNA(Asn)/Glu-tRNA(Gln) amidotransferase C subunit
MPYIRRSGAEPISTDTVKQLGHLAGLDIPAEDLDELAEALTNQLASVALLDQVDLSGVDPILEFDPRWPEGSAQ